MEKQISKMLCERYQPEAIILHGSRASGHARKHSDWDCILLYAASASVPINGRMEWRGQNIECTHHPLPVDDVLTTFGIKLQNARVVHDPQRVGEALLQRAGVEYDQPLGWSTAERSSHALWVQGRIDGMRDTIAEPLLFHKYATDFYGRITNYWYWAICDRYPQPIYLALEEIQTADAAYYELIQSFVTGDAKQKIIAAEKIQGRCFGTGIE